MNVSPYKRPKGILWGTARTFAAVARPWLDTGKRGLDWRDAELVCMVCEHPHLLAHADFRDVAKRFADLLRDHPEDVGNLTARVGRWRAKQRATKTGRVRLAIEIAMTRHADKSLDCALVHRVADAEKIDFRDVSPQYIRGRVDDIRREVAEECARLETPEARAAADAWFAATLRARAELDASHAAPARRAKQIRKVNP